MRMSYLLTITAPRRGGVLVGDGGLEPPSRPTANLGRMLACCTSLPGAFAILTDWEGERIIILAINVLNPHG